MELGEDVVTDYACRTCRERGDGCVGETLAQQAESLGLDADGEVWVRGPQVMKGYLNNAEATAATIDDDGWLHTGDVGKLDDEGFLFITDRKKDLFVTSAGKNIAPSELERLLTSDPFIDQAVVYGDGRHFISALIVPNAALLHAEAEKLGCDYHESDGFVTTSELIRFMQ